MTDLPTPFLDHLEKMIPDLKDRHAFLSHCALAIQMPGYWNRERCAFLLQGPEGIGKGFIVKALHDATAPHALNVPGTTLINKFNGHWADKNLIIVEDFEQQHSGSIKHMITDQSLWIEMKGLDAEPVPNMLRFILTSSEIHPISSRRIARIEAVHHNDMMPGYFAELYSWLEVSAGVELRKFLQEYVI